MTRIAVLGTAQPCIVGATDWLCFGAAAYVMRDAWAFQHKMRLTHIAILFLLCIPLSWILVSCCVCSFSCSIWLFNLTISLSQSQSPTLLWIFSFPPFCLDTADYTSFLMAEPTSNPEVKDEVAPPSESLNGSAQPNTQEVVKDAAVAPASETPPKLVCKKHEKDKKKKKNKKRVDDTDSSSDSSSSSSDSDSDADSEETDSTETESDTDKRKRHRLRKARARRALKDRKRRKRKKQRSRKAAAEASESDSDPSSGSETESSTDSDEEIDDKTLRKLVSKLKLSKKRAKKLRDLTSDDLAASDPLGETRREKRSKKKKPASKVAYKRVDLCELFDWSIFRLLSLGIYLKWAMVVFTDLNL